MIKEYQYARLRIARATIFNIPFLTTAAYFFIVSNKIPSRLHYIDMKYWIWLLGAILFILSIISWKRRDTVYKAYLEEVLNIQRLQSVDSSTNVGR